MIGTIVLIVLVALGILVLLWIFLRKLPQVRMVDPSTSPDTRSRKLKYEIMKQRVERASGKQADFVHKHVIAPIGSGLQSMVRRIAGKFTAVERAYQDRKKQSGEATLGKDELAEMIEEGKRLMKEELWDRAEKKFIEAISNDPKNVDAYEYLGRLYQYKKDYKLAKQTFQYLLKLSPDDASVIAGIGEVEEKLGNMSKAMKQYERAVELSPKNPKYLDFLISAAIEEKKLAEAKDALDTLKEVNPKNKKIEEFEAAIDELRKTVIKKEKK